MNSTMQPSPEYLAEDNSAPLMQTCISFLVLETVFMVLLYVSRYMSGEQKANWSMVLLMTSAYLVCVSKITVGILSIKIGGAGRHMLALAPATISTGLKLSTALQIVCPFTTSLSKLSVLCLLDAILGRASHLCRCVIRATFVLVLVILLVQVIIQFANCRPFSKSWNVTGPGTCTIDSLALWRYLSLPNVLTTIVVVGIPLPALYRLNVSTGAKLGLTVVFFVCIAGIVAAIMRVQAFLEVRDLQDLTFYKIKPFCWTVAESGIYLMAGVMLTLRPLARKVFGNVRFDKILSRAFGGSGSSAARASRRWSMAVHKGEKVLPTAENGQKTGSDVSSKITVVMTENEKIGRTSDA